MRMPNDSEQTRRLGNDTPTSSSDKNRLQKWIDANNELVRKKEAEVLDTTPHKDPTPTEKIPRLPKK